MASELHLHVSRPAGSSCPAISRTVIHKLILLITLSIVVLPFLSPKNALARANVRSLTVGVYENAPKVFTDKSGKPAGIFMDILEHIAENEGWKLRYVPGTWGEGLDRLEKGEIDLMPDVAYTSERARIYSFHKVPILSSWYQVYASKGINIQSILDLSRKRVLVLERSVQQKAFDRLSKGFGLDVTVIPVPDYKTMFEMVASGEADAAITNNFYGKMHGKKFGIEDTGIVFEPSDLFFAASRQVPEQLLDTLDRHMAELKRDPQSVYYDSLKRWTSEEVRYKLPAWLKILGLALGVGLVVSLLGSSVLKHQINARTRELKQRNQEMEQNIAERKETEKALYESERKYRELVQNANSIILRWNRGGEITFMNEFGRRFFGYSEGEILGRHVVGTIVPETESTGRDLSPLMDKILAYPEDFEKNINENIRRNGDRVWVAWTNKIVKNNEGQVLEILSIGSDITERKHAEEELEKYRLHLEDLVNERTADLEQANIKLRELDTLKSMFIASMSHELRTPLNSIIGFTGMTLQGLSGELNDEQKDNLARVYQAAKHLLALITDVIDISKIEAGRIDSFPEEVSLGDIIAEAVDIVNPQLKEKRLTLTEDVPADLKLNTDRKRLLQCLINLLSNGVKYTEKGGIVLAAYERGADVEFSVADTGIGIAEKDMPRLFEAFERLDTHLRVKAGGTGLGLYLTKKLATDILHGSISVRSTEGKGSTFTLRVPRDLHQTLDRNKIGANR